MLSFSGILQLTASIWREKSCRSSELKKFVKMLSFFRYFTVDSFNLTRKIVQKFSLEKIHESPAVFCYHDQNQLKSTLCEQVGNCDFPLLIISDHQMLVYSPASRWSKWTIPKSKLPFFDSRIIGHIWRAWPVLIYREKSGFNLRVRSKEEAPWKEMRLIFMIL